MPLALPAGAELVDSSAMRLPPGAELVGGMSDRSVPGYQRLESAGKGPKPAPAQPSPAEQVGKSLKNQAKGAIDLLSVLVNPQHGIELGDSIINHTTENWKQAQDAYRKGDYSEAIAAAGRSIPILGSMIEKSATDISEGRPYEAATDVLAAPALAKGAGMVGKAASGAPGAVVRGAVRAGAPDVAIGAAKIAGGAALDAAGAPYHVGTVLGVKEGFSDLVQGGKKAVAGGKAGLDRFRALQQQARQSDRPPVVAPPSVVPNSTVRPDAPPAPGIPGQLPSGRKPGGIQNQTPADTPLRPTEIPISDPMDAIAKDLGYTKPYAKLNASQQLEVKIAQRAAAQEAEKAALETTDAPIDPQTMQEILEDARPPKAGPRGDFSAKLQAAFERLKEKGALPADFEPGKIDTDGPRRFEEGSGKAPVIDSTKSRFKRPVANPEQLGAGQLTQQIARLDKMPNRTPGETNLLTQLREEVKKRGTK